MDAECRAQGWARASATQLTSQIAILALDETDGCAQLTNEFENERVNLQHGICPSWFETNPLAAFEHRTGQGCELCEHGWPRQPPRP